MSTSESKTVGDILRLATPYLTERGVEDAEIVCGLLLSRLLNCKRLELHGRRDQALTPALVEAMRRGLKRCGEGEPVQYVLGEVEFGELVFKVDKRALIPRPETEELVDWILKTGEIWQRENPAVADIGTGSGCIVISLAMARPDARYLALDVSEDALALARENAQRHQLAERIIFARNELCELIDPESLDVVVANLPYISTDECEQLPRHIREHEPRTALDGGPDGLRVIADIVQDAIMALKPDGFLFLEIGDEQGAATRKLLEEVGYTDVEVRADLAGRDRMVRARPGEP